MNVDDLAISPNYQLRKILNLLENLYGLTIDFSAAKSKAELESIYEAYGLERLNIIQEAHHNSYNQNPEYTKACLIQEAIRIFLSEVAPKRRNNTRRRKA
jgi:hypothetical protein